MGRRKSPTLTEAELRLMNVLWDLEQATVSDVVAAFSEKPEPHYSTVLTTLRILEQKGYVSHRKRGRAFVYRPRVARHQARRDTVRYVLSRFFDNSPASLVLNILEHERLDPEELEQLRRLIGDKE